MSSGKAEELASTVLITGATGYIGRGLSEYLTSKGYEVVKTSRKKQHDFLSFDLTNLTPFLIPRDCNSVVHLAYIKDNPKTDHVNLEKYHLRNLLEQCAKRQIKLIFLSSMSSYHGGQSIYSKSKFELERLVVENNQTVLKPGLVFGGANQGLFGQLSSKVKFARIKPIFLEPPFLYITSTQTLFGEIMSQISGKSLFGSAEVIDKKIKLNVFIDHLYTFKRRNLFFPVVVPMKILWILNYMMNILKLNAESLEKLITLYNTPDIGCPSSTLSKFSIMPINKDKLRIDEAYMILSYLGLKDIRLSEYRAFINTAKDMAGETVVGHPMLFCFPSFFSYFDFSQFSCDDHIKRKISLGIAIKNSRKSTIESLSLSNTPRLIFKLFGFGVAIAVIHLLVKLSLIKLETINTHDL